MDDLTAAAITATANALEALTRAQEAQASALEAITTVVARQQMDGAQLAVAVDGMTAQLARMQARQAELVKEQRERAEANFRRLEDLRRGAP